VTPLRPRFSNSAQISTPRARRESSGVLSDGLRHGLCVGRYSAVIAIAVLARVGAWYKRQHIDRPKPQHAAVASPVSAVRVRWSIVVLVLLIFSKYFYVASITSYFSFYLIEKFHVSVRTAQLHLFVFLLAMAMGTLFGGPLGDRIGRKRVIWVSILGITPFTLILPYVDLMWVGILTFIIGLILSSAFSAIVVFAQELMPHRFGMISGVFFGVAFGIGGLGAAVLGRVADHTGIGFVYQICAFLPAIGLLAVFLPKMPRTSH